MRVTTVKQKNGWIAKIEIKIPARIIREEMKMNGGTERSIVTQLAKGIVEEAIETNFGGDTIHY